MKTNRPPIIAVVGHIDHGKSTLLHKIREAESVKKETGDITQHIGAYEITAKYENKQRKLTMIDTPGHSAFSHIREHGIYIADMALLVVSAVEGFKEQTKTSYDLLKKNDIPFIVVFTKMDIGDNNFERAKQSLLEKGIYLEGLGGDVPYIGVSAVEGKSINELIELIFLTADLYEITEDKNKELGILIEVDVDEKTGIAGTIILKNGSISKGDFIVVGDSFAPVRIMKDDLDNVIEEAHPSKPIRIVGFSKIPEIGGEVKVFKNKKDAQKYISNYVEEKKPVNLVSSEDAFTINIIAKADTGGSLSSLVRFLEESVPEQIKFKFIKIGIGNITEDDVRFLDTSNNVTHIIGFHNKLDQNAKKLAEQKEVEVSMFETIYNVSKWLDNILLHSVREKNKINQIGKGKIIRIFEENKEEFICGIEIVDGKFYLGQKVLVLRKGAEIGEFDIKNLEIKKQKVEKVSDSKTQFAALLKGSKNVLIGDEIIGYE